MGKTLEDALEATWRERQWGEDQWPKSPGCRPWPDDDDYKQQREQQKRDLLKELEKLDAFRRAKEVDRVALEKELRHAKAKVMRLVKIALRLFKHVKHQPPCEADTKIDAVCACGLAAIEQELTREAAAIVLGAMDGNQG